MVDTQIKISHDFKGISYSKIGHFKEVQSKIKELEKLNLELARRHNRLEAIFNGMSDGLTILDQKFFDRVCQSGSAKDVPRYFDNREKMLQSFLSQREDMR